MKLGAILASFYLLGCSVDNDFLDADELADAEDDILQTFFIDNDISASLDTSGIYYVVDTANSAGESALGQVVSIYYTAWILNGSLFDEHTEDDGDAVIMEQGANAIWPIGLDDGLALMREGETFTFYLPSAKAYSFFQFSTLIPSNSIVVFQVTVDEVQSIVERLTEETNIINTYVADSALNDLDLHPTDSVERLNSGVWYKTLVRGSGSVNPQNNDLVSVQYIGTYLEDGTIFDQTTGSSTFDYPFNNNLVIPGFDAGIGNMVVGERAMVIMPSNVAYASSVRCIPAYFKSEFVAAGIIPGYSLLIDPFDILIFEIELESIN